MTRAAVQAWYLVHKWTSLACTAFLLLLCVTGLPLIFGEEIAHLAGTEPELTAPPPGATPVNLDVLIDKAKAQYPGNRPLFLGWYQDAPVVYVNLGPTADTPPARMKTALFDAYTGAAVPAPQFNDGIMFFILRLHTDMFAGLPGKLFLGAMGLLFAVATISGVVLYRPFMRKLDFGTVRRARSTRLKWLDLHNLLGIATTAWLLVVGLTGVINTLDEPLYDSWQKGQLVELTGAGTGRPVPTQLGPIERAVAEAKMARPELRPAFVSYPGTGYSGEHHYGVFMIGHSPLDQRNYQPVLVDAATSRLTGVPVWPLSLSAMYLSQPLHFGDYAGLPLKIIWAVLDIIAIIVLGSGIYLWLGHRGLSLQRRVLEVVESGVST
ncbi:PepSY-associated TM helix domain-containing protein [Sphingomonas cavernae]|uniref:PepSY domain-containing protein n=1 Tax=Sphingomonas cavernae TaxID=2320861 RepID=A0A418WQY7_9SPHN|nr:PepSY-associated TM helix domain-containing protein [Sphingomonas cavernae]RJF93616.1 PepSY domain-containing protein [Sphingomonas cavernae]